MTLAPVSVIMPAYNNADTIGRALASIAAQTTVPAQIVVVDDGSDDHTYAAALSWQGRMNGARLVVLRQSNQGAGAARNRALAEADQDFVAFLDADDEWLTTKIEQSLAHFSEDTTFVSHDMILISEETESLADCHRHFQAAGDPFLALMLRGYVATSTVVARRRPVMDSGGFVPSLRAAQDYDLWLTLAEKRRFVVFNQALTRYHVNPHGITANISRRRDCSLEVLRRHKHVLGRSRFKILFLRTLIIQYEAFGAWLRQHRRVLAAWEVVRTPWTVLKMLRI